MANDFAKFKNSQRRHRDDIAIARQVKIAKSHGLTMHDRAVKEPHRMAKHHAMDCGQPGCMLCGNPRRNTAYKSERLTAQERRLFQDLETTRDKHSNGLNNDQEQ
jgi:hypothetical protein